MRIAAISGLCLMVGGCAFPAQVRQFGVEYNSALAEMSNEQTLLNILRAKDGMPTHFTSVSQFRGSINLTGNASLNGQFRGQGLTSAIVQGIASTVATTNSTSIVSSGTPSTTTGVTTVTTTPANNGTTLTTAEGVDLYSPTVSGQIVTGTNFDVSVFDTQKFYNGITSSIPFPTIETFLNQGIDNRVIALLTIARIDIRIDETAGTFKKGDMIFTAVNDPSDARQIAAFRDFVECYELASGIVPADSKNMVAISRMTRGPNGEALPLTLEEVALIDGEKLGLSAESLGDDPTGDKNIYLTRLTAAKRVARLAYRNFRTCQANTDRAEKFKLRDGREITIGVPKIPPSGPLYVGTADFVIMYVDGRLRDVPVKKEITFRSPEGVFRYLGDYLALKADIAVNGKPLFTIADGRSRDALAQATYRGKHFSLLNEEGTGARNARIFTLLQQLVNLHKEASERPTSIPVRAVP